MKTTQDQPEIPDTITLTAFAGLFRYSRSTLSAWKATDSRFPKPDAKGRFNTFALVQFTELHEFERMSFMDIRNNMRESVKGLEETLTIEPFSKQPYKRRILKLISSLRAQDPEDYRRERIAELEAELKEYSK